MKCHAICLTFTDEIKWHINIYICYTKVQDVGCQFEMKGLKICVRDYMDTTTLLEGPDGMLDQRTNLFSH